MEVFAMAPKSRGHYPEDDTVNPPLCLYIPSVQIDTHLSITERLSYSRRYMGQMGFRP